MYLKSIEVQGFKSFANKINFDFHNGITGIVGPNGSGKSNVADAVRWVLGEQRVKQLRGAKMEDVIFSGTENRKALGFAYVAITLDNSDHQLAIDFDEVTVSRRIFRSGESEYMINGVACRLKDINELFYDTGIGKEGYSIIGQGQIDKILSGRPEERRELFDEAVGIVKFKRRKNIACKKLDDERQNIVRIKDILSELEKQVTPLEKQSETAKEYLKLRDELKKYELNGFLLETEELKIKISEIDEKIKIADSDMENSNNELENSKLEYNNLSLLIDELEKNIEEKKNFLNISKLHIEKHEGEIKVINEQINAAKSNHDMFSSRINAVTEQININNSEKEKLDLEKAEITESLSNSTKVQSEEDSILLEITNTICELQEKVENAKNDIIELLNEKSSLKTKIQRYETMLEQINYRKNELTDKIEKHDFDKAEQEKLIKELEEELNVIETNISEINAEGKTVSEKIKEIDSLAGNLNKEIEDYNRRYHQDASKLDSLKNITERYEGYGNSIKRVMEFKEHKPGIIGVVADIIKVEKQYEVAVETALGGSIQNIVTDDEQTAKDAIAFLKKNKYGRATFLPLNSIGNRAGFNNERVFSEKGVIGLASELVKIKKEYEGVAKYLLGRIVVVDHIDNALLIARKYNHSLRIVTLEGDLLNVGGSLTGGAYKNTSNLLGRRREITELEKSVEETKIRILQLRKETEHKAEEKKRLAEEFENKKLLLQEQMLLKNTVSMNIKQAGEKHEEIISSFENIKKENEEISNQITDINCGNDELINELSSIEEKNNDLEQLIKSLNEQIEEKRELESKQNKKSEEIRIEHSNLIQRNTFVSDNLKRVIAEIERLEEEKQSIEGDAIKNSGEMDSKTDDISRINALIEEENNKSEVLEKEIEADLVKKEEQTKDHKEFLNKREELSERISELDKYIFRLNSNREKHSELLDSKINYIWEEYELTLNSAMQYKDEEYDDLSQIKKIINELKNSVKSLGAVNVNAIEEYKTVLERYEFLKEQHDDLVVAEENLIKIIEELDTGMRERFNEEFSKICTEFDIVFKELFGGGKGTIELMDDEADVLEAGIRITAQPPGKKLQNMMQLSGGEKALTAISLLFAIQNLKPSPFCLLDEIEAALDDSNVDRFANYLHKLTKFTQFIVITHRKGTMASSDRLYGITMQEKGISTLVSVDLLENELEK